MSVPSFSLQPRKVEGYKNVDRLKLGRWKTNFYSFTQPHLVEEIIFKLKYDASIIPNYILGYVQ